MARDRIARLYEFWYQIGFCATFLAFYEGCPIVGTGVLLISLAAFLAYDVFFADIGKGER